MKYLVVLLISIFCFACNPKHVTVVNDSAVDKSGIDSYNLVISELQQKDTIIKQYQDSLFKARHSKELFEAKFKLAKINRYLKIVKANPKNSIFFYGWIRRTMEQ